MNNWKCPLNGRSDCTSPHAIGIDGSLRHTVVNALLLEKGWKVVNNPKRVWYPEFDQTHPSYKENHLIESEDNSDILEVEKL